MAKIVLTMATTHGPQLHTTPDEWLLRIPADKSAKHPYRDGVYTFDELVKLRASEGLAEKSSAEGIRLFSADIVKLEQLIAQKRG